jgi:hypothetical protein
MWPVRKHHEAETLVGSQVSQTSTQHKIPRKSVPGHTAAGWPSGASAVFSYELLEQTSTDNAIFNAGIDHRPSDKSTPQRIPTGKEWIPPTIRLATCCLLTTTFILLIAVLEIFDVLDRRHHGFAVSDSVKTLARYFPTIVVVCLAFVWDMVLKNLKEMGPWSLMARGWTPGQEALHDTNYIDALDIKGLFQSMKRRQIGITFGYVGALLCGALVPFANNLFFTDPSPRITTTSQAVIRTSQLAVNNTFTGNGGLSQNSSEFDPQSFLTYMAISRENYAYPQWTIRNHALEGFNVSESMISQLNDNQATNMTVSTTTGAFSVKTTCDPVRWSFYNGSSVSGSYATQVRLLPDPDDLQRANCHIFPDDYPRASLKASNVSAWINFTTCGDWQCPSTFTGVYSNTEPRNCGERADDDLRLVMNVWNPDTFDGNKSLLSNSSATVSSLLCKVEMFAERYTVEADARTGDLVGINAAPSSSQKLAVSNPESIVLKINQFLKVSDSSSYIGDASNYFFPEEAFLDDPVSNSASGFSNYFDNGELGYWPGAVRPGANSLNDIEIDRVILMMSGGNNLRIANYAYNMSVMADDLSTLLEGLLSQVVSDGYRMPDTTAVEGSVTISTPVLRLRQVSLRVLESMFGVLAMLTLLSCTALRPRTHLRSDPRTLGAIGIILSTSAGLDNALRHSGNLGSEPFRSLVQGISVRTHVENGKTVLEFLPRSRQPPATVPEQAYQGKDSISAYQPVSLHWAFRTCLVLAVAAMITGLGISWWQNDRSSGYPATSRDKTYAIIFVPSTLLVLLGYATQAVDSAVQSVQNYVQLARQPVAAEDALGFNPVTHSVFTVGYRSLVRSRSPLLLFSSGTRFLIPAIKIVAAALFTTELRSYTTATSLSLDSRLVDNLNTYNLTNFYNSDEQEILLRTRATTLIQFAPSDHTSSAPVGLSDGIVFSGLDNTIQDADISSILNSGADTRIRMSAVQVKPWCETFGTKDYGTITPWSDVEESPTIKIICNEGSGLGKCPSVSVDSSFNTSSEAQHPDDIEYYWNKIKLTGDHNEYYSPPSPEWDGIWDLQNVTTFVLVKGNQANSSAPGFKVTDVASFWCNLNYTAIHVDAVVGRSSRVVLGAKDIFPLAVKSYDAGSITPITGQPPYTISHLNWTNINDLASFRSIYPLKGKNILYNTMRLENPEITDDDFVKDPELLGKAGGQVLAHFAAQMINLARPYVRPMSDEQAQASVEPATISTTRQRLIQSKRTTFVLQGLLGVVMVCILLVVVSVTTKSGLAKPPNSVGAQAGLMAGSELVRLVRDESRGNHAGSNDKELSKIWNGYLVSLGWWEIGPSRAPLLGSTRRFGIDIGDATEKA